jgi:tRNA modification GTPase
MSGPDTIYALSSGRPPAAIAVVRISGPKTRFALETMIGRIPQARQATLATVKPPDSKDPLDQALVLWFPSPRSETGEDMAELQLHGGAAVVAGTLAALRTITGFRPAEPGEFTRRAFENGRLDLTAVEGLADLIGAETEAQRRQALRQLTGFLGKRAETWRARLIEALALVEAGIDFPDEGDVPTDLLVPALQTASALKADLEEVLKNHRGERLRDGLTVAIAGPPNAGKSTIFNYLARRDAAIVTPYPGTTRDVLELHLDLDGYPVTILDTAGIRKTDDPIEQEGIRRAQARAGEADLTLWITDVSGQIGPEPQPEAVRWLVRNKADLTDSATQRRSAEAPVSGTFTTSAKTGEGMSELIEALKGYAATALGGESALVTRERHRQLLTATLAALDRGLAPGLAEDLVAEELRSAAWSLGRLLGRVDVEDLLDAIFRDFCIGK